MSEMLHICTLNSFHFSSIQPAIHWTNSLSPDWLQDKVLVVFVAGNKLENTLCSLRTPTSFPYIHNSVSALFPLHIFSGITDSLRAPMNRNQKFGSLRGLDALHNWPLSLNHWDQNGAPGQYSLKLHCSPIATVCEGWRLWDIRKVHLIGCKEELQEANIDILAISQEIAEWGRALRTVTDCDGSHRQDWRINFPRGRW